MLSTIIWTLCFLGFLALFGWQVARRLQVLKVTRGAPERFEQIPRRIKEMLVGAIAQMKFFNPGQDQPAGIIHALVFWGFLILGLQVATMFLRGWLDGAYLPLMGPHLLGGPYMFVRDVMEAVVLCCAIYLLARWLITHPRRLMGFAPAEARLRSQSHWEAVVILIFISTIMITGMLYDGGRMVFLDGDPTFGGEVAAERHHGRGRGVRHLRQDEARP